MRKMITTLVAASLLATAVPAFALFTNGGFEANSFAGWTLDYGNVASSSTSSPAWTGTYGSHPAPQIVNASTVNPGQTLDVDPYNGSYMAMINDINGSYHATSISQTATIAAEDLGDTLYVNWGAMLVDPSHPADAQPFFSINVLKNSAVVDTFSANASDAATPGSGWVVAGSYGGPLYYKSEQYSYDLSSFAVGDKISIEMFVADCGYGGHGGYAFLDGIGTDPTGGDPGTEPVPEPSTMLLLGGGLAGLAFWRRKLRK